MKDAGGICSVQDSPLQEYRPARTRSAGAPVNPSTCRPVHTAGGHGGYWAGGREESGIPGAPAVSRGGFGNVGLPNCFRPPVVSRGEYETPASLVISLIDVPLPAGTCMDVIILDAHPVEDVRIERHITYLADQGVNVCRIHYNYPDESARQGLFHQYGAKGFRINLFSFQGKIRTLYFMGYCLRRKILTDCRRALEALEIDPAQPSILHVHDPLLLPLAGMLVKRFLQNSRVVYDRHEVYEEWVHFGRISIPLFYEDLAKKWISGTVVVSERHLDAVRELFPESRVIAVPNYAAAASYDVNAIREKIHPADPAAHIHAIYIGSLNNLADRDVDLLLDIADAAIRSYDNVTFFIGGTSLDEGSRMKIEALAGKHNGRFQFLGDVPREKTVELTEKAHIGFLLVRPDARYWVKTSPNKIYEYLVCGTVPIIRADVDHADRLRACSLIFDRTDENEVILNAVLDLLGNSERLKQYMSAARELSTNYTWESVACRYIELYTTILSPGAVAGSPARGIPLSADGCGVR